METREINNLLIEEEIAVLFSDLFELDKIQHLQDLFADANGVASIITLPDGNPITTPSNFTHFCNNIIRKTEKGCANCIKSDAIIGRVKRSGPTVQTCLSGGLWDAGVSIIVDGKHIANWLIGQVRNVDLDTEKLKSYAKEIGANQEEFFKALKEVPFMPIEQFEKIADMLFIFANELSEKAFTNYQLKQETLRNKKAEEALKKSEEKFRIMYENMPNGFYRSTPEGYYVDANPAFIEMLGYKTKEELLKIYIPNDCYVNPAERDNINVINQKLDISTEVYRLKTKDGRVIWVEDKARYVKDENNNIIFYEGFCNEITERKLAEQHLEQEQFLMDMLMENLPQSIYFKDRESRFLKISKAHANMFKLNDPKEAIGKTDFDFFTAEHAKPAFDDEQRIIKTGLPMLNIEERETWADRRVSWVSTTKFPMYDKKRNIVGTMGISHDITERKSAEEQLKQRAKELNELNATKDKFFSIIAHDLRSPFNSILGFSDLLVERIRKKNYSGIHKYAEIIQMSSNRAMELLMNLMEWAQSQTGRMEYQPEHFDLTELIDGTELLLSGALEEKSINLIKNVPSNVPVYADKKMINTVIRNLISNAIKFTHTGGDIKISVEKKEDETVVSVSDTGVGISKANCEKLFKIDQTYSTTGTKMERGTGLGLILCKEFVEKQGGKILVESKEGEGSDFKFTIPRHA